MSSQFLILLFVLINLTLANMAGLIMLADFFDKRAKKGK